MADWNPSLYLQFDAERTRPAADLLSRIAHLQVEHAVDLGCGPGNSTRLLRAAWPLATIVGIFAWHRMASRGVCSIVGALS